MGGQALDLKRSARIVRQRKKLVGTVTALGLLAGLAYTILAPPVYLSSALVAISPKVSVASQTTIATSDPVIARALPEVGPGLSLDTLQSRVMADREAAGLMSVKGYGTTPAQAIKIANAVAGSYVAFAGSPNALAGPLPVRIFQTAVTATGTALAGRLVYAAGPGVLFGVLVGVIIALAVGRNDQRLRYRDEIADSIGVPVLASVRGRHPAKAAGWAKLLASYEPEPGDAWRLRNVLHELQVTGLAPGGFTAVGGFTLCVLSISGDRGAVALGPQLAVCAAAAGIPTSLVVGPQQDADTAAALREACAAVPEPGETGRLRAAVSDDGDQSQLPPGRLTVVVAVADGRTPRVARTMRGTATLLAVTSGAVTAQQLARVAASAASDGREIAGILVADPDPADQTTGRLPQLARPGQDKMPTRMTGAVTEIVT